jgi:hypothetical protein
MSKPKLTPWFRGSVKPVRVGIYQRRIYCELKFSRWDGRCWMMGSPTFFYAEVRNDPSPMQDESWRGLASDPKART